MKLIKLYISLVIVAVVYTSSSAQNGINYKAIVKDDLGNVVANQNIDVQFSILKGVGQANVYQETHTSLSDDNGIIIVNIGEGTTADDFTALDWGDDTHFLNVQIDIGAGLVDMGTTEFKTVPYALNAANVTGLNFFDEGNDLGGWRLISKNPDFYGGVGVNAIDLSHNNNVSSSAIGATGAISFASGVETSASGFASTAMGYLTEATGTGSFAVGSESIASGSEAFTAGELTTASGNQSTAMGLSTTAAGNYSFAVGFFTSADARSSIALGSSNIGGGSPDLWVETDPLFEIGNGSNNAPSNALTILKNGTITAPSFDISEITDNKALITKEYLEANSTSASGLEAIDEGSGIGWRLIGKDPSFFGNININAVDLSTSDQNTNSKGATGQNAFAAGTNTLASGNRSTALGNFTTASAFAATALGSSSSATADGSVALGVDNTASGFGAIAMGGNTISDDEYGTAVGVYNDNTVSTTSLFQVGNGTFEIRSNAFNIDEDGTITAPSFDIAEITDAKALITKEYADANYSGGGSGTSPTGLEAIDEGNGFGWRLIGQDPANYENVGLNAIDLSISDDQANNYGASGTNAIAMGNYAYASGLNSTAIGFGGTASGILSSVFGGSGSEATQNSSIAVGYQLISDQEFLLVVGKHNDNNEFNNSIFQVGNGTDSANRSNAFNVDLNGTITAPSFDISEITDAKALITKEYADANYSGGGSGASPTGLEAIDEGNGFGWRLIGQDPANYENVGLNAIDLSTSTTSGNSNGALGNYSFTAGLNTIASGFHATALGSGTEASGNQSTSMGLFTLASGDKSTAMGNATTASAEASTAMGFATIADDINGTVIGKYNDNTVTTTSLFQVGNGNNGSRSNALTIDESGEHTINSSTNGLVIDAVTNPFFYGIYINSSNSGLYVNRPNSIGVDVFEAENIGVRADRATTYGGYFSGYIGGIHTTSENDTNPDIILGGTTGFANTDDDGIISSDPDYSGSDIFLRSYDAVSVFLDYDNNETGQFEIKAGDGTEIFEISETGNATLAGTLTQNSDRRLKRDITTINYGLNEVLQLQPKAYYWKNRDTEKKSLGLIAQEVQSIISEIVNMQDDAQKTLGISYSELIPVLIKAIQEQQVIIDNQKNINTKQSALLQALAERIDALEGNRSKTHTNIKSTKK